MGAPTLNKKKELNYRRKSTSKACQYCNHYDDGYDYDPENSIRIGNRIPNCRIIGLSPGRAYRISPNGLCDSYDGSKYMDRISGGMWRKPKETEAAQ